MMTTMKMKIETTMKKARTLWVEKIRPKHYRAKAARVFGQPLAKYETKVSEKMSPQEVAFRKAHCVMATLAETYEPCPEEKANGAIALEKGQVVWLSLTRGETVLVAVPTSSWTVEKGGFVPLHLILY